ncbi:hypothetical protein F4804DRAFT_342543 [Jackrogersella minutella]|nr:hypothetical protein F4804DRAFT_342543 [Jackrogersella minutella]
MAEGQDHIQQEPSNYPFPLPSRRRSLPRRNTEARPWEPAIKYGSNNQNKAHRRFSSVLRASPEPISDPGDPTTQPRTFGERPGDGQTGTGFSAEDLNRLDIALDGDPLAHLSTVSIASTSLATGGPSSHGSNGSVGSRTTVTERPFPDGDAAGKIRSRRKRFPSKQPNVLNFLDSDSPMVTAESIRKSMEEAASRSPTSLHGHSPSTRSSSTATSGFRDDASENIGENETDRSTSPERGGEGVDDGRPNIGPRMPPTQNRKRSYGFPDIPQGNPEHSNIPPTDHVPREATRGRSRPTPRPERLPLTGYELLATKLSTSPANHNGPHLRPIFRRFEMLNNRLLLYLQDEICELEEQLHRLDAADTQNRRLPECFFPASRRAEFMAGGELHWHKTDILGKIGFKLEQYNRLLSSSRDTQGMPVPTLEDIHEYRNYLATHAPIAEVETRFLDATDDLICVSEEYQEIVDEDPIPTPIPHTSFTMAEPRSASPIIKSRPVSPYRQDRQEDSSVITVDSIYDDSPVIPLSIAVTVAVILPILTFLIIPGYLGRLTVVFLVGLSILGGLIQGGIVGVHTWELLTCVGLYGAVMAVIAGIV